MLCCLKIKSLLSLCVYGKLATLKMLNYLGKRALDLLDNAPSVEPRENDML